MQLIRLAWALTAAAVCFLLLLVIHNQILREGQLAAGTCEIVNLDRDSSQPKRTIARQTARCACRKGQIAGTTRARPACVDAELRPPRSEEGSDCSQVLSVLSHLKAPARIPRLTLTVILSPGSCAEVPS
ncbi:chemokine-like protein TAFA-5 isoform X1 [Siniperca chuatsi]|uniref:chemokine-like protein TAFA-5 isoform X1 n=1 Tax=Siniperca chuatsi TaxID=119488 RepID=UPI001CE0C31E|nr:chemokine-like protein TAFA-5 isoform X1 [Siniperca chuatsi]